MPSPCGWVLIAVSSIHGTGGFALRDLEAGTCVLEYSGELISKEESLKRCAAGNSFIFSVDDQWDLDGDVEWNQARWLNHSCSPNCEAELIDGRIWIVTLRPIRTGEELTFNYGYDLQDLEDHPCACGAPTCVGFIVAEVFHDAVRRRTSVTAT